jgi:hypothetical protein
MHWKLHGLEIQGATNDTMIAKRWSQAFAPIGSLRAGSADIAVRLDLAEAVPPPPDRSPDFTQGDLLRYYLSAGQVTAHFPRYGRLVLDLEKGTTRGEIVRSALDRYGVFEDLLAVGLSPHLRRRGLYLVHAFAAALDGQGVLLVGGIGAGKTTTGMSLLDAGWKLLSNDSPALNDEGEVLLYPGVLAGYQDTYQRFEGTRGLLPAGWDPGQKFCIPPADIWPGVWLESAPVRAILFPNIKAQESHLLEPLPAVEALRRLLPNAVEQWDRAMIPAHLTLLRRLVEEAPAFALHLGADVTAIPAFLEQALFQKGR